MDNVDLISEIDRNYAAFQALLPQVMATHGGQFALLRKATVIGYFDQVEDAAHAGETHYPDGLFSIQEVVFEPANLGFYSYAYDIRPS